MNNKLRNSFSKTLLALSIASATTMSQAGSFGLIEHSASGMGSAFAGASALGEDASTVFFNPAAMTRLSGEQMVFSGHIIVPQADFTNNGSTDALSTGLPGPNSEGGALGVVPNFYYAKELSNGLHFGLGVNVPFGLATDYDEGWVGRYHALLSEIATVNINPSLAWNVNDSVSVGFGLNIQYLVLELTNNIDSYGACVNLAAASQGAFTGADCVNAGLTGLGLASDDSKVKLDGDSLELGWNAGLLMDVGDSSRIGVSYRSAIKHGVEGDATYDLDPRLQPFADGLTLGSGFNVLQSTPLTAAAELPESFSFSYVNDIDSQWTALFDWTWVGWSSLDVITIRQLGGIPGQEPVLDLNYADTNRYSVGVNYKPDDMWVYRGGLAYDETPVKSPESNTARIPGNDRTWLSFGVGYKPVGAWSYDVGYSHLFIDDIAINNSPGSSASNATLAGTYEAAVDIFSAQANMKF